jgi:hypothetical protein
MPTLLRIGQYRLFFYSSDYADPPHVHVERDDYTAKFWLEPVRLHSSRGFGRAEVRKIQDIVEGHRASLLRSWNEYFND